MKTSSKVLCGKSNDRNKREPEIDVLKGFFTVLIIIGHNKLIAQSIEGLFNYLYTFHVHSFFLISSLYMINFKKRTYIIARLAYVYILFLGLYSIIYSFYSQMPLFSEYWLAVLLGSPQAIKSASGFYFLWFIPAFVSYNFISLIGSFFRSCNWSLLYITLLGCLFAIVLKIGIDFYCINVAMYLYFQSELFKYILEKSKQCYLTRISVILSTIVMTIYVLLTLPVVNISIGLLWDAHSVSSMVITFLYPIFILVSLWLLFSSGRVFKSLFISLDYIGKNSLTFYLFHPVLLQTCFFLLPAMNGVTLIFSVIFSFFIPFLFSITIYKYKYLNSILYCQRSK